MGVYVARMDNISISAARTLVQVNAPATSSLEILRAWVSFNSVTSTAIEVRLKRVTTAGTGTSFTAIQLSGQADAFDGTCTNNHTAEGTLGDELIREFINYLNGFIYLPIPEERIVVPPSARIALDLPTAPGAAVNISAGIVFRPAA
jgi:hypothetical protein